MKVWHKGGGLPIGEPKDMSLTRKGNQEVRTESLSTSCQHLSMCGVISIYRMELSSVACAGGGSVGGVSTQREGVGRMASGQAIAGAFDIEADADCHSSFVDKSSTFQLTIAG